MRVYEVVCHYPEIHNYWNEVRFIVFAMRGKGSQSSRAENLYGFVPSKTHRTVFNHDVLKRNAPFLLHAMKDGDARREGFNLHLHVTSSVAAVALHPHAVIKTLLLRSLYEYCLLEFSDDNVSVYQVLVLWCMSPATDQHRASTNGRIQRPPATWCVLLPVTRTLLRHTSTVSRFYLSKVIAAAGKEEKLMCVCVPVPPVSSAWVLRISAERRRADMCYPIFPG